MRHASCVSHPCWLAVLKDERMKLKITIDMSSAAFEPKNGTEIARMLRDLAELLDGRSMSQTFEIQGLRDANGNRVGEAKVTK
jgi:hypothetical protein